VLKRSSGLEACPHWQKCQPAGPRTAGTTE